MKHQIIKRSNWAMSIAFLIIFAVAGCAGPAPATLPPESVSTPEASPPPPDTSSSPTPPVESTATLDSKVSVQYEDNFINKGSGWEVERTFDNYFIGYHEPEWYHVEVRGPNYRTVVPVPNREIYSDTTIDLQVFAVSSKTTTEGDFRFGLAFRRSGDNYYAFAVSPTTKEWKVFKYSSTGQVTLKEGKDESINDLDIADLLRVDAQGSNFLFHINDHQVAQVTDTDYPEGEVGLYAENIGNSTTHIHFDTLTIREVKISYLCNINGGTVNVRRGPGRAFPQFAVLSSGDIVQALGISSNQWIKIVAEGSDEPGWVSWADPNVRRVLSCNPSVDLFLVINP